MGAINELNNGVNKIASSAVIADGVKCDIIHQQVRENAQKIEEVNSFKKIKDKGLRTIRSKEDLDHKQEFWLDLLQNYDAPLDIASRTLSPWLKAAYREKFLLSIEQRLKKGHHVHLLIQKPNSEDIKKLEAKLGKNISKSAGDTLSVLKSNIWCKLTEDQKKIFRVKVCESVIPYIYIDNGQSVTISPYMSTSKAQGRSFLVVFDHTSQYIEGFGEPLRQLTAQPVRFLRRDLAGTEGLTEMVGNHIVLAPDSAGIAIVLLLGIEKLGVCDPAVTAPARYEFSVIGFLRVLHIVDDVRYGSTDSAAFSGMQGHQTSGCDCFHLQRKSGLHLASRFCSYSKLKYTEIGQIIKVIETIPKVIFFLVGALSHKALRIESDVILFLGQCFYLWTAVMGFILQPCFLLLG